MPASLPTVTVGIEQSDDGEVGDGIARAEYHGIPGLFVTWEAWRRILVRVEEDKALLSVALARSVTAEKIAADEAEALRKNARALDWRATWLPVIAFVGGAVTSAVVGIVVSLAPHSVQVQP